MIFTQNFKSLVFLLFFMPIKRLDDIEREKDKERREKMKRDISEDINDVIGNVFGKPKTVRRKGPMDMLFLLLKIFGILILVMIFINLILGNIWLLKFFIKDFFIR